jgi:hypothetical protein
MVITDERDTGYSNSDKDVVFTPSHTNLGMLERLSFIKFISLFFNKETQASGYYADQYERWNYMAGQVAAAQARGGIPTGYKCAWVTAAVRTNHLGRLQARHLYRRGLEHSHSERGDVERGLVQVSKQSGVSHRYGKCCRRHR